MLGIALQEVSKDALVFSYYPPIKRAQLFDLCYSRNILSLRGKLSQLTLLVYIPIYGSRSRVGDESNKLSESMKDIT
jgi:hypothetical protein